jgi:hypothetical protein
MKKLLIAILRGEPWGHIKDLWGLATGKLVVCGKPPYEYLMHKHKEPTMDELPVWDITTGETMSHSAWKEKYRIGT